MEQVQEAFGETMTSVVSLCARYPIACANSIGLLCTIPYTRYGRAWGKERGHPHLALVGFALRRSIKQYKYIPFLHHGEHLRTSSSIPSQFHLGRTRERQNSLSAKCTN